MNQQRPTPHTGHPTDDTVLDLAAAPDPTAPDPTAAFAGSGLPTGPTGPDANRWRTRRLVAGAVALALALGIATAVVAGGSSSSPTTTPAAGAEVGPVTGAPTEPTGVPGDPSGSPQAAVPEAQPEPQPPVAPGLLVVDTPVIWLFSGDYDGIFTVRNDGGSAIDWSFQGGIGAIGVSQSGGTLAPGASTQVSFSINPFQLADGPFVFVNHVVGGGADRVITIHGEKTPIVVNPDIPKLDLPLQTQK